ncbi:MAG: hypothetical protein DMG94_02430 [Acidobacteria bacterium]|nr:MAG: hypothetical protein DMG94_02430 [Acidobacteriota bacterium]
MAASSGRGDVTAASEQWQLGLGYIQELPTCATRRSLLESRLEWRGKSKDARVRQRRSSPDQLDLKVSEEPLLIRVYLLKDKSRQLVAGG